MNKVLLRKVWKTYLTPYNVCVITANFKCTYKCKQMKKLYAIVYLSIII